MGTWSSETEIEQRDGGGESKMRCGSGWVWIIYIMIIGEARMNGRARSLYDHDFE